MVFHRLSALLPQVLEKRRGKLEQIRSGSKSLEKGFELLLHHFAADRLALRLAVLLTAEVVGIMGSFALRPVGCQRVAAASAKNKTAQWEVFADVFPRRDTRIAVQAVLDRFEGFKADQSFMLRRAEGDIPFGKLKISCIERLRQEVVDPLIGDFASSVLTHS